MVEINKKLLALLLVVAILLGAGGVLVLSSAGIGGTVILSSSEYEQYADFVDEYKKLNLIKETVLENYYEPIDEDLLMEGAYTGMLEIIDDPYTQYIQAKEWDSFLISLTGVYSGIGMTFTKAEGEYGQAISVTKGSPAAQAGVKAGDIIIAVDGQDVKNIDSNETAELIRGKAGTSVTVTYKRGEETFDKTMVRADIVNQTVDYKMLEDGIGYIELSGFEDKSAEQFAEALNAIAAKGAKCFVLDLRNNPGGLTDIANDIADQLMDKGTIVYTEDSKGNKEYMTTTAGRTSMKYVVLVNENSASAAEILATGIKANNEGLIVGTKTYGKGIIQSSAQIYDGSALKMTIMQYFSPSGEKIHGVGVTPDYIVELVEGDETDYQLNKALELLKAQ